ncbi:MAG: hypothetical protein QM751_05995 [Paludibacteraceae bacterium]
MPKLQISKVYHRGDWRICIRTDYDKEIAAKIKQLPEAKWSKTMNAWYIPYTNSAFKELQHSFTEIEIIGEKNKQVHTVQNNQPSKPITLDDNVRHAPHKEAIIKADVEITVTQSYIYIKLPKKEADTQFLLSFRYTRWQKTTKHWIVVNYKNNLERIKQYFSTRNVEITEHKSLVSDIDIYQPEFNRNELLALNFSNRTINIYFVYNRDIINQIKKIPYTRWNNAKYCWSLPYSKNFLTEIRQIAESYSLTYIYREVQPQKVKPRYSRYDIANYRECPAEIFRKAKRTTLQ